MYKRKCGEYIFMYVKLLEKGKGEIFMKCKMVKISN